MFWNDALKISTQSSYEELLGCLIQFYEENGSPPTERDFNNNHKYPNSSTYANRFGSWNNALKAVGLDAGSMVKKGFVYTCQQKARLFEMIVLKRTIMSGAIDLSGVNCCSPVDGVCPKGQIYDAKSVALINNRYWPFHLDKVGKVDFYYLGAFDRDYKNLLHVWRIPGNFIDKQVLYIGLDNSYTYNIENMKEYEIDLNN